MRLYGSDDSHQYMADFSFNLLNGEIVQITHNNKVRTLELGAVHILILLCANDGTSSTFIAVVAVKSLPVETGIQHTSVVDLPCWSEETVVV